MSVHSLEIYNELVGKINSIIECVLNGEYSKEVAAQLISGMVILDVAEELGVDESKVVEVYTGAVVPDSPWYKFYHSFVFPMDKVNMSMEENPPDSTESTGYVYVIMNDASPGAYKIGITLDPEVRINSMNRNLSPDVPEHEYYLCVHVPGYRRIEKELHARYANKNVGGEWFDLAYGDLLQIRDELFAMQINE